MYGSLTLRGHGFVYADRSRDFTLLGDLSEFDLEPGIENVLLPGLASAFGVVWKAVGFEYTNTTFLVLAAVPYALFIYGLTRHLSQRSPGGRLLAVASAIVLYTSGMIPYMTSWGGYVDGLSYLLILPVVVWPESLVVYAVAFVLQCTNHYLGALAQLLVAFVWHSMKALDQAETQESGRAVGYWLATIAPRVILSVVVLAVFMWFWENNYPEAARVRQALAAQKWQDPQGVLLEVLAPFPWTLLSTLKLTVIPVAALMLAAHARQRLRMLILGVPFLAAGALTFVFVDITRVATMLVLPALLATIVAAGAGSALQPRVRRTLRRLLMGTALLNLLIPNYYVNNGEIIVPRSEVIRLTISRVMGAVR